MQAEPARHGCCWACVFDLCAPSYPDALPLGAPHGKPLGWCDDSTCVGAVADGLGGVVAAVPAAAGDGVVTYWGRMCNRLLNYTHMVHPQAVDVAGLGLGLSNPTLVHGSLNCFLVNYSGPPQGKCGYHQLAPNSWPQTHTVKNNHKGKGVSAAKLHP